MSDGRLHCRPVGNATLPALLLAATLPAQQFVVDIANGPGTDFTSLTAAIAAVPDGATVFVRAGNYAGSHTISAKGLTIVATGSVVVGDLSIQNTLATQAVVVRGVDIQQPAMSFSPALQILGCQGRVLIEGAHMVTQSGGCLSASSSGFVVLRNCTAGKPSGVSDSYVVLESCFMRGLNAIYPGASGYQVPTSALSVTNGRLEVLNSSLFGGNGDCPYGCALGGVPSGFFANQPAISLNGGTVTLRGNSLVAGGNVGGASAAVGGTGTLRRDTTATVNSSPAATVTMTTLALPDVVSTSAAPGGTMSATATCQPGDLLVLLLGLPGNEIVLPGVDDSLWVDPLAYVFAAASGTGSANASLPVPPQATMVGVQLLWQGAVLPAIGTLQLSQPSLSVVH